MKRFIIPAAIVCLSALCSNTYGQTYQSGFFLDNFCYGYRTNPALVSDKSFFAIGVGDITPALSSDLGLSSVLFKGPDGGLVTGFHPSVSSADFLGNMKDVNSVAVNMNANLISWGKWKEDKKFKTFEINIRANGAAGLPKDLFSFLKDGSGDSAFNLRGMNVNARAFAEIAVGRSYVGEHLTIGWRAKGIVGLANAGLNVNDATMQINKDVISYDIDATLSAAAKGLTIGTKVSENTGNSILDLNNIAFDPKAIRPCGFGAAIDLGASYTLFNMLTLSASITDLGAISWNNNIYAKTSGAQTFSGLENLDLGSDDIGGELDGVLEKLKNLGEFVPGEGKREMEMLPAMANIGVRARFLKRITVGYLGTFSFGKNAGTWADNRIGAGVTPFRWLSLSSNIGVNSFGSVWGAGLAVNLIGLNIHAGFDGYRGPIAKFEPKDASIPVLGYIPVPVNSFHFAGNVGLTMTFGQRHGVFKKEPKEVKMIEEPQEPQEVKQPKERKRKKVEEPVEEVNIEAAMSDL